jgi:mitogen-activated protein kinase organizer 1
LTYSSGAGQYILSGSSDRTIKLWNPAKAVSSTTQSNSITSKSKAINVKISAGLIQSYTGVHGYEVLSVSVSSDNARFVSSGGDKNVFLWDVATAQTLRRFSGHNGRVECVIFAGEGDGVIVSGSYDASVRIWDTRSQNGKPLMSLNEAKDSVTSLAIVDAEILAGSVDGRVRTYDLRMGGCYVDVVGREFKDDQNMMTTNY